MTNAGNTPAKAGHVFVLGECLVDLAPLASAQEQLPDVALREQPLQHLAAMPGGSPANVAIGLARLGVPTLFGARFSRLGFGPWLRKNMAMNGVDLALSVEASELPTLAVVTLDAEGRASYTFYGPGTADWQWQPHELVGPSSLGDVLAVHTGSLALAFPPGADVLTTWLRSLREQDKVLICIDPNVRPGLLGDLGGCRERIDRALRGAHVVKMSTEDLGALAPGETPAQAATRLLSAGVELVVITDGPKGATAFHGNGAQVHVPAPTVDVVDTIGAGDTFSAGLLAWLFDHDLLRPAALATIGTDELLSALAQAVMASASACTRAGADPPDRQELAAFSRRAGNR
ncbi:MAG: carbohydrate kinase family protein [Acidimicrobiales bacterium]